MKTLITNYILKYFSQRPKEVDKLIVSAFYRINKIEVKNNRLLKTYIISQSNKAASKKVDNFIQLIEKYTDVFNIDTLIELFEFVISPADRIVTGAVYTPKTVREYIVQDILKSNETITPKWTACDIACGCGGFLYTLAKHLKVRTGLPYKDIFRQHLFGLDIKSYSIARTKILLTTLAIIEGEDEKEFKFNLYTGDALRYNWCNVIQSFKGFNSLVGNPPYVCSRKIDMRTKQLLSRFEVCKTGHPDLYIPFFQIGLGLLKPEGVLGYITMNSFFKSLNGRALREYFQINKFSFKILDFGTTQVFQRKSTYTCICLIKNKNSDGIEYSRIDNLNSLNIHQPRFSTVLYSSLRSHNGWNLLSSEIINKIESVGTPFSDKYITRNGIATLKNDIYIFNPIAEDREYYYLQNGNVFPVEKGICKEIINPNILANQHTLANFTEKFIFPYEFINDKAIIFSERKLREEFPLTYDYLNAKKSQLKMRDRGEGVYPKWYAFGRTQCLEKMKYKLFFPHITPTTPNYIVNTNEDLFFYNGIAVIGTSRQELLFLKKLMSSRLFWFYIKKTSKPYYSGYFSLSKTYIKDFGIYDFTEDDIKFVLHEENIHVLDEFFERKYDVHLPIN